MTFEEFTKLVDGHDLTHAYSDMHSAWVNGDRQLTIINNAAKNFPEADVVRVWNAMVDRRLVESARSMFYRKVKS